MKGLKNLRIRRKQSSGQCVGFNVVIPRLINQRLKSIEIRKDLTDEWEKNRGVKPGNEFAI